MDILTGNPDRLYYHQEYTLRLPAELSLAGMIGEPKQTDNHPQCLPAVILYWGYQTEVQVTIFYEAWCSLSLSLSLFTGTMTPSGRHITDP